jgi:succinate dehydrogenase/fumarate reductase flavoprotein subunit
MTEMTADVIVVGFGGAGAVAAMEAHDAGASVVILEKAEAGGGSTSISSGSVRIIDNHDKAANHYYSLAKGATPMPVVRAFVDNCNDLADWIRRNNGTPAENPYSQHTWSFPHPQPTTAFPNFPDADGVGNRLRVKSEGNEGGGMSLWNFLRKNVESRQIKVLYKTSGKQLIQGKDGRITGIVASGESGDVTIHAKRAVILTCGGFNYNPEMQRQFFGFEIPALSRPGLNTGDGIRMAMAVGADLWHMRSVAAGFGYKIPGFEAAFPAKFSSKNFLVVDQKAQRFADETSIEAHAGLLAVDVTDPFDGLATRLPSYLIFDEQMRKNGPIVSERQSSYNRRFGWSKDNSEEVKKGWITTANSIGELAGKLGLDAKSLEEAVKRYNAGCASGEDEFGRQPENMKAVDQGPFYGIALWPALLNTQGGPRRDENAQIVNVFGKPIPGLYSAGELGSIWGTLYPGAGNVTECLVFGRIAGRNAAKETPLN